MIAPRRIEYIPVSEVPLATRNPKKHAVEGIVASMQTHGFLEGPYLDERTQQIVGGHGRIEALIVMMERGLLMPEGLVVNDVGEWCIPVQRGWASKSDAHAEAVIVLLNRLTELGGWDDRLLAGMLHDIQAADPDLFDQLLFSSDDMDNLLRTVDPEKFDLPDDELLPAAEDNPEPAPRNAECPSCGCIFDPNDTKGW